ARNVGAPLSSPTATRYPQHRGVRPPRIGPAEPRPHAPTWVPPAQTVAALRHLLGKCGLEGAGKLRHDSLSTPHNDAVSQRPELAESGDVATPLQVRRLRALFDQHEREFPLDQTLHRRVSALRPCPQSRWGYGFEYLDRQRHPQRKGPYFIADHGLIACVR